jgi:hypothetical protein
MPAKSLISDPEGFGGYGLDGPLTEISAAWNVPTIAATSPEGDASTWVGVDDKSRDFIQLGTLEDTGGPSSAAFPSDRSYQVFWSDTSLDFHPHILGQVAPGDQVTADMAQTRGGWNLTFRDDARHLLLVLESGYGGQAKFTRAEWFQEDPTSQVSSPPYLDIPYPSMSTVTFQHLLVDRKQPHLSYDDASNLASVNGVFLVPTRFKQDGFMLEPADPVQAQYLQGVEPINVASTNFMAAYQQNPTGATTDDEATAWISAIDNSVPRFLSDTWPPSAGRDLAAYEAANKKVAEDLSAWESAAPSSQASELRNVDHDRAAASKRARSIRADIGLPPPS